MADLRPPQLPESKHAALAEVEGAIDGQVTRSLSGASSTESFWGRVVVNGRVIQYHAWTLSDGTINVGTYYVVQ